MKRISFLVVLALASSSLLVPLVCMSPAANAMALTSEPVRVYSSGSVTETMSMSATDDGKIFVVWSEKVGEGSDIFYSFSSNNGTTFSSKARVNRIEAGAQRASQVVTAGNNVYVVWEDGFSDSGDIVLACSSDNGLTFQEVHVSDQEVGTQSNPTVAASGNDVAVAWEEFRSDNTIRVWDGILGNKLFDIQGHQAAVRAVEFSPNGTYLASGSEDSAVKIWNAATGALFRNITEHTAEVLAVNWSADGKMLATGSFDHNVTLFNTTDFSVITRLNATNSIPTLNNVNAVSFSPDSGRIAVAYHGRYGTENQPTGSPTQSFNLTVWNLTDFSSWTRNEDALLGPNRSHTNSVLDVAFSHNGTYIVSGSKSDIYGNTMKIWNSTTGQLLKDVPLSWPVQSLSWSPDDRFIAAGLGNGSIALVNVSNIADIEWLDSPHTGGVNSIDWSVARNEIVSGAADPVVKVRDNVGNTVREVLAGHINSVYSVDWSSTGRIATAGGNSHFYGMGENQIFCAVSNDGGRTFEPPAMVSDSCAHNRLRPKAGMDRAGNISVAWYDSRKGGTNIYYANSTDGGASFKGNLGITKDSNENTIPSLFVSAAGTVHIAWQYGNGAGIKYANSTDGFSKSREMAQTAQTPHVTGSPDGGSLLVSWRQRNTTELRNYLRIAESYDGGAGFPDVTILNSSANFIGEHAIFTDIYNQTFAAWETNEAPSENIYFRTTVLSDQWRPTVLSASPAEGEVDVSIFTSFTVVFSEPMDRVSVEAAFSWTDGTRTWYVGNCTDNGGYWYDDEGGYDDKVTFTPKKNDRLRYQKSSYSFKIAGTATDLAGNSLGADAVMHFTTSADTDPPLIEHYPSQATVSYDEAYGVMAMITDQWGNVSSATLHYQGVADSNPVRAVEMTLTSQSMYRAEIPAQLELGTVYYYISAADAFGNEAWSPANYTNHSALYTVSVVDGVKPIIQHDPVQDEDVFRDIEIWAVVSDAVQLLDVHLNYKPIGASGFTNVDMEPDTNGTVNAFRHAIPAQVVIGQVQYNITAVDASGNFNTTPILIVQIIDATLPLINSVTPAHIENETMVRVTANVTDDVAVDTVTLYFMAVGGDQWVSRQMEYVSGDLYQFTIPAQRRSGTIYYYVNATDTSGNTASTLTEQEQFQIDVVGVSQDNTLYYVLGIVLAVLTIVMVYLVVRKFSGNASERSGESAEVDEHIDDDMPPGDSGPENGDDGR